MATDNASFERGVLVRHWTWPVRVFFWSVAIGGTLWFATVCAHWLWASRTASDPLLAQQALLERELAVLGALTPRLFEPPAVARWIGTSLRDTAIFSAMGFARALMNWPVAYRERQAQAQARAGGEQATPTVTDAGAQHVREELASAGSAWALLVSGTYIFAVRTAMFLSALPMLALAASVAVADGLVARAKRKATAGRESSSLYHRAKLGLSFVPILGYMGFLLVPEMHEPARWLVPMALAMAWMLRMQATYYKKYL